MLICSIISAQCDRQVALNDYNENFISNDFNLIELAWTGNTNTCDPGTIADSIHTKMLSRINYFRRMCDLNDNVVFDSIKNIKCMEAAVMQEANNSLSHCSGSNNSPCNNWLCNTSTAIEASQSSNLAWANWNFYDPIEMYMEDSGSSNIHVGHRRWLLFSKATTFGNGLSDNRNALWVFGNGQNATMNNKDYIAYPPDGYIPQDLVYDRWSFGIPNANFTNAQVIMTDELGNNIPLNIIYNASVGYGDYTIVWEPTGINTTDSLDVSYEITISNINNAPLSSYTYSAKIMPLVHPPACPMGEEWIEANCMCEPIQTCIDSLMVDNSDPLTGSYEADSLIISYGIVALNDTCLFKANNMIDLTSGFEVPLGSSFEISMIGCQTNQIRGSKIQYDSYKREIELKTKYHLMLAPKY